jgi:release factor glutamine methyltransferase
MRREPPGATVTWRQLYTAATERLGSAAEARWMCETSSGFSGREWSAALDQPATRRGVAALDAMLQRRGAGEPLQYVLGAWAFRTLDLAVDRRVLIPRPETELVVEVALAEARAHLASGRRRLRAADLGTGSGAIALSLAAELPVGAVDVWACEVDAAALSVASANLAGAGRPAAHVRLAEGSWYAALPADLAGRLDLVVSNPPYIAEGDPDVAGDVVGWEPPVALFAGRDGLDALRVIIGEAPRWLAPGGVLVCEIGATQGTAVRALALDAGLVAVEVRPDLAGHERILLARRAG